MKFNIDLEYPIKNKKNICVIKNNHLGGAIGSSVNRKNFQKLQNIHNAQ